MHVSIRAVVALTSGILLAIAAKAPAGAHAANRHKAAHYTVSQLYSPRARRRAVTILQLKLLELHEDRLDRLRQIILRKLPIESLLKAEKAPR